LDACPIRDHERVHKAVRALLARMNIELIEQKVTGTGIGTTSCVDIYLGSIPVEKVKEQMQKKS